MKRLVFAVAAALALVGQPARAEEAAANFVKLFSDVCMVKFGHLDTVQAWAENQNLPPITNPKALAVFAGKPNRDGKMISFAGGGVPGSGKAWAVHDPAGRFVLATRLDPESCVVWAQKADPGEVVAAYAKMVAQTVAPGVEVKLADDRTVNIPDGTVHIRVYRVWGCVMSGCRPLIKGFFQRCADRGCGHVFGLVGGESDPLALMLSADPLPRSSADS